MTYSSDPFHSDPETPSLPPPSETGLRLRLPVGQPFITYILLASIVIIWILMELTGGSTRSSIILQFGNFGPAILEGESWRLFTSMFLHGNFLHLAFNAYALFIFGLEMESLYQPGRYLVVYVLSGLYGSLASFAGRGADVLSIGASGAIFGIIGMNLAFFLLHRATLGDLGRARIQNTLIIIVINLIFGFTVPGIDNLAHLGGLLAGFILGYGLAPRYQIADRYTLNPRLVDTVSLANRWWVPVIAIVLLAGAIPLTVNFWLNN